MSIAVEVAVEGQAASGGATSATSPSPAGASPEAQPPKARDGKGREGAWLVGAVLTLLAVLLLGLLADLTVLGALRHGRDQQVAYADLRQALAHGTAPVNPVDGDGRLLALGTPLALLEIPAIGLNEVVLEGTTSEVLMSGPGHRRDTVLPGQEGVSVVMGRRAAFGGPFRDLADLREGEEIRVITGQGEHTFRVIGVRRAGDEAPPRLERGAGRLTLVTADGSPYVPTDVMRVDAELTSDVMPTPARAIAAGSLPPAEETMGSDAGALVPLVLWGQLLVVAAVAVTWASARWGRWQAWIVGVPVLAAVGVAVADQAARLLPNLL